MGWVAMPGLAGVASGVAVVALLRVSCCELLIVFAPLDRGNVSLHKHAFGQATVLFILTQETLHACSMALARKTLRVI